MSVTNRSPLRMAGANINSGFAATGEVAMTRGGQVTVGLYSGNVLSGGVAAIAARGAVAGGSDILIFSGAGRLNTIIPTIANCTTATPVQIYDGHVPTSGGPFVLSGHIPLFSATNIQGALSGSIPPPIQVDAPFFSGLIVACRSGQPAISFTYSPEVNQPFN